MKVLHDRCVIVFPESQSINIHSIKALIASLSISVTLCQC